MKLIMCVDDNNGIMFNKRRQSRDIAVTRRIMEITCGGKLWMSSYSAKLFSGYEGSFIVDDNCLERAGDNDYCFIEDLDVTAYLKDVNEFTIYRWNRAYPSDVKLPFSTDNLRLKSSCDFAGNSHEKITEEIYESK